MKETAETAAPEGATEGIYVKQRAFTRIPFARQVRWSYAPGESGVAALHNICRGGICAAMSRYLRPGRVIAIRFDDIVFKGQPLEFDTRIVWCDSTPDETGYFRTGFKVLHGKPVTLAKMSEVFYQAVTQLAQNGMPEVEPGSAGITSPSLAS